MRAWQCCGCVFIHRLKAEIEKLKLEYEESATQEQQKHSNEVKVSDFKSTNFNINVCIQNEHLQ